MLQKSGSHAEIFKAKVEKARVLKSKALDEVRFLRTWIESPLKTGAVAPSSSRLADKMASYLEVPAHGRYLELGPGTGAVTKAIFDRGIRHQDLTVLEYSPEFSEHLASRFPGLDVLTGDAYAVKSELESHFDASEDELAQSFDGIVSSLPLLTRPEPVRRELLSDIMELLKPGAPFIQFSYGILPPVRPKCGTIKLSQSEWIWKNLPPARVWIYRKIH